MLEVNNLSSGYDLVQILWNVSFNIKEKEIISIIGPNGAGKTTLVRTIAGLLHPKSGTISFKGENIEKLPPYDIVKKGITMIPEGREIFPRMTVEENLLLGAYTIKDKKVINETKEKVFQLFPVLKKKEKAVSQTLSGGEQQMLVICRSLMSNPKLLILDEPSLGLAQ
jgi:branched-chain amino acid transport system ATP-binding protein